MLGFSVNPEGSKRVFIRSYCTKRGGEEKRRGQNTELGGSDPTFRPFGLESDPWVAPAHRRNMQRRVFWPLATGREKRRELEERKEKASATILPLSTGNPTYSCQGSRATPHLVWTCGGNRPASRRTVRTDSR